MDIQLSSQDRAPQRVRRGDLEKVLRAVLQQQQSFAIHAWELFNSLGYRIDCQGEELARIRDRLWKLEHPQGRKHGA